MIPHVNPPKISPRVRLLSDIAPILAQLWLIYTQVRVKASLREG